LKSILEPVIPSPLRKCFIGVDLCFGAGKEPVKEALGPAVAESLRAVFAAFLWHEGLVHDAMACSSFLKFHPELPKQGAVVVTRHQPGASHHDKVLQRHSVEVSKAAQKQNMPEE